MSSKSAETISGIRHKIKWAEKRIDDLKVEVAAFLKTNPYEIGKKTDADTGRPVFYMVRVEKIPVGISHIAGDAIHNLRSPLDWIIYTIVEKNGGSAEQLKHCSFQVFDRSESYSATKKQAEIKILLGAAKKAVDAVKPYKGGNDDLWILHRLNNIDKHRLMLATMSIVDVIHLGPKAVEMAVDRFPNPFGESALSVADAFFGNFKISRAHQLKTDDVICFALPDLEPNKDLQLRLQISFNEPPIIEGKSILDTCETLLKVVSEIATEFEPYL